jgi:hypothetical protein
MDIFFYRPSDHFLTSQGKIIFFSSVMIGQLRMCRSQAREYGRLAMATIFLRTVSDDGILGPAC